MTYTQLPEWASRVIINGTVEIGAQLCTRDGRRCGNGAVLSKAPASWNHNVPLYTVVTDMGSVLRLTLSELSELFYPPKFVFSDEGLRHYKEKLEARV